MGSKIEGTAHVALTLCEHAAIMDRLNLPEAIAEALTDAAAGDEPSVPEGHDMVAGRVEILARLVGSQDRTIPPLFTELDKAILVDAVEGSTYAAGFESHERRERAKRVRVLNSLAQKMVAAGIAAAVEVPNA
jgi:hypothetical protein